VTERRPNRAQHRRRRPHRSDGDSKHIGPHRVATAIGKRAATTPGHEVGDGVDVIVEVIDRRVVPITGRAGEGDQVPNAIAEWKAPVVTQMVTHRHQASFQSQISAVFKTGRPW